MGFVKKHRSGDGERKLFYDYPAGEKL